MLRLFMVLFCVMSSMNLFAETSPGTVDTPQVLKDIETLKAQVKELQTRKLECSDGNSVTGTVNKWSPWSSCPQGMVATGLARVDIQGDHEIVINHVNDFQCGSQGCRAWCIGNGCEVIARCCK